MDINFFIKRNRIRNYLHFDRKLSDKNVFKYVSNPENIARHSFFPTICYFLNEKKIFRKIKKSEIKKINQGQTIKLNKEDDFSEKKRLINIPSHIDGNIYAYYSKILEEKYEIFLKNNNLKSNILAFRKIVEKDSAGKLYSLCNIHFAKNVFSYINHKQNCVVLCLDISGFFDNLDHVILKKMWIELLGTKTLPDDHYKVYKSLSNYAYVKKDDLYKSLGLSLNSRTLHKRLDRLCDIQQFRDKVRKNNLIKKNLKTKGIPQGSPISGMLSNIYMMNFDQNLFEKLKSLNGEYYRYCDDMIFIMDEPHADAILSLINIEIEKLKLKLNLKKTQNIIFSNGIPKLNKPASFNFPSKLQYLGIEYDGKNVFLREKGISKFNFKLRKAIRMRTTHYKKIKKSNLHNNLDMYMILDRIVEIRSL